MNIELVDARRSDVDREWLTRVYSFYLHDLSEFDAHYYQLNARGLWEPDHLSSWLVDDTDHPLIIVESGERVGFALVNQAPSPHMAPGSDYRMSEFFVLRRLRRRGIGRRAAYGLFDRFSGVWEISELPANTAAIAFWRHIISAYTGGEYQEEMMPDGMLRQMFRTVRSPAR